MVPAKADWSFNRWLTKSRTPVRPVAVLQVAARAENVADAAAPAAVPVVGVVPGAAMIVIVVAAVAAMVTRRPRLAVKNWLKS
jgi:hypothetical protein